MTDDFLEKLMQEGGVPLVDYGREAFGLCPEASRKAGKLGHIPTVKIGGQFFVPCARGRTLIGIADPCLPHASHVGAKASAA